MEELHCVWLDCETDTASDERTEGSEGFRWSGWSGGFGGCVRRVWRVQRVRKVFKQPSRPLGLRTDMPLFPSGNSTLDIYSRYKHTYHELVHGIP
jgi:hypothetical protein